MRKALPLVFALLLSALPAWPFGQNKVQYERFRWSFYETPHFNIYFPQDAEPIARFAAAQIETLYAEVSRVVGHRLAARVPVILHNSHVEFQQTNVIRLPLHEGIGGFTEIFKNRVVLPFEGDYGEFRHVLQHELVHAVVFDMLFGENAAALVSRQMAYQFPLWVNEGLAEYASLGWNLGSEFFMLDATTFGYVAPPTTDFGGFLAYKGGQLFFHFVEETYGPGTVTRLIQALKRSRDLPASFKAVTKTSLEEAGEIWMRELRHVYWPELGQRQYGKSVARQLTRHGRDLSFYNLQPALSPDGKSIAFFSDRGAWNGIHILDVKTEKVTRTVLEGGKSGKHESFHSFKSGIAWSPDGKSLALVSQSRGRHVLHLVSAKTGKVQREIAPDLTNILSPAWSRDGRFLAFSASAPDGLTDLHLFDLKTGALKRLSADLAHDDKPTFSPSGRFLAFESNRPSAAFRADAKDPFADFPRLLPFKDVYLLDLKTDSLRLAAGGAYDEKMPSFGPADSLLAFVSNRSGVDNIYIASLFGENVTAQTNSITGSANTAFANTGFADTGSAPPGTALPLRERPVTNLLSGCFTPDWSRDGKLLAFSLFEQGGWDLYLMRDPLGKRQAAELPKTRFLQAREDSALRFFRPLQWENLRSYAPPKAKKGDSARGAGADSGRGNPSVTSAPAPFSGKEALAQSGRGPDPLAPKPPSPDSLASKTFPADSLARKTPPPDSLRLPPWPGDLRRRPYTPVFSLDMGNVALGFSNLYGPAGIAFITLSDLMGDQEIDIALDVNSTDFRYANAYLGYDYLPLRTDLSVLAYYQSQLSSRLIGRRDSAEDYRAYLDRQWGLGGAVRYPFSVYSRAELLLKSFFAARTPQKIEDGAYENDTGAVIRHEAVTPTLGLSFDNTQWGIVGPVNGQRAYLRASLVPPLFQDDFAYMLFDADLRRYFEFAKRYTLALRLSSGFSKALGDYRNPHSFLVGGDDFTLNYHTYAPNLPSSIEDLYFFELDTPLRGFDYFEFRGTRKFLGNIEFRYPFIREFTVLWPIPFSLRHIAGTVFADYGGAWNADERPFDSMGLGLGFGMRVNLGIFVLRYTRAWAIEGVGDRTNPQRDYWSLGAEF